MTFLNTCSFTGGLLLATLPGLSLAQDTSGPIETLTVTGSRLDLSASQLAGTVSVLTEDDIRRAGAVQLTDLLRGLPGVSISTSGSPGGLTEIRLRGSESNHLLVLIDGVVANDIGQGGLIDLAHLTTAGVTRIELLNGAQSALWGSGAIGGVLSITTANGSAGNTVSVQAGAGNQSTSELGINGTYSQDALSLSAYLSGVDTAGENVSRTGSEADGYRNITGGFTSRWQATPSHTLSAQVRATDYTNDYDGTDYAITGLPADADNVTDGNQFSGRLGWLYAPLHGKYSSELAGFYRRDKNDNTVEGADAGGTTGERTQLTWTLRYALADSTQLALGAEYLRRDFAQRGPALYGDPNQEQRDHTSSAFADVVSELSSSVTLTGSARFDNNSEFDDAFSYRLGVNWAASDLIQLFAATGRAIKTPTFTERFGYFPASFIGNSDLKPETSTDWEAGFRFSPTAALTGQISVFHADLDDEILGLVATPQPGIYTAANATTASERQGVETTLSYRVGGLTASASYTYLDASQDSETVTQAELRRARHQGGFSLSGDLPVTGLSAYLKLSYTGTRSDTYYPPWPASATTVALGAYTLVSANIRYAFSPSWSANLRVDNALDTQYEDIVGYSGQSRRVLLSVRFQAD